MIGFSNAAPRAEADKAGVGIENAGYFIGSAASAEPQASEAKVSRVRRYMFK